MVVTTNKYGEKFNQYGDYIRDDFPLANKFFKVLRKRCLDADPVYLSPSFYFDSYFRDNRLFVRGWSDKEIFFSAIKNYLEKIDFVEIITFHVPRFGIEAVSFSINTDLIASKLGDGISDRLGDRVTDLDRIDCDIDFDSLLPSVDVMKQCMFSCYQYFHKQISTRSLIRHTHIKKYKPTILVCMRYNIPQEIEDIIHEFLGCYPINRYRSVASECTDVLSMINEKTSSDGVCGNTDVVSFDEHYRIWNNVSKIFRL